MWAALLGRVTNVISVFRGVREVLPAGEETDSGVTDEPKTIWDHIIDALNRLVRPLCLFGTILLFVWAALDPAAFTLFAKAIGALPAEAWVLIITIFGAWFTAKGVKETMRRRSPLAIAAPEDSEPPAPEPEPAPASDPKTAPADAAVDDLDNHNPAIAEWRNANKRNPN